jgi:Flp pilus assembly protein TadG
MIGAACLPIAPGATSLSGRRLGAVRRLVRPLGSRGVAAVEFAFCAPVLVILTLICADLMTALRAQLRLETAAVQLGQIVSQCTPITPSGGGTALTITTTDVANFFSHGQLMIGSLGRVTNPANTAQGSITITAVRNNGSGANQVAWQRRQGATGPNFASTVANGSTNPVTEAAANTAANIANSFIVPTNETLMVTEIFLDRGALLLRGNLVLPQTLRASTLFISRSTSPAAVQAAPTTSTSASCTA